MANYSAKSRTNYFRVTEEDQYQWLFFGLCCDDDICDFTEEKDGVIWHSFGGRGSIDWVNPNYDSDDPDYDFDEFLKKLQTILHEDDAFILEEVGSQKYCYLKGFVLIATRNDINLMGSIKYPLPTAWYFARKRCRLDDTVGGIRPACYPRSSSHTPRILLKGVTV